MLLAASLEHRVRERDRRAGFTLLEVMIVLAIIGLIVAAISAAVFQQFVDAKIKTTKLQVRDLQGRVDQHLISREGCPTFEDLVTAFIIRRLPKDAWGNAIELRCPGEHPPDPVDIISNGPDKIAGTKDDIKSWEL